MGRIADIHHLLPDSGLHIVGEHFLPIHHQLLGLKDATLGRHQEPLQPGAGAGAVRATSSATLKLPTQNWYDTAGSAKHVAEMKDPTRRGASPRRWRASFMA